MDKNLLKSYIVRSGYTNKKMSEKLGISEGGFSLKMQGHTEFTVREIRMLILLLGLSGEEVLNVFFG